MQEMAFQGFNSIKGVFHPRSNAPSSGKPPSPITNEARPAPWCCSENLPYGTCRILLSSLCLRQ